MRTRVDQIELGCNNRRTALKLSALLLPIVLHHFRQSPDQQIDEAADLQTDEGCQQRPGTAAVLKPCAQAADIKHGFSPRAIDPTIQFVARVQPHRHSESHALGLTPRLDG